MKCNYVFIFNNNNNKFLSLIVIFLFCLNCKIYCLKEIELFQDENTKKFYTYVIFNDENKNKNLKIDFDINSVILFIKSKNSNFNNNFDYSFEDGRKISGTSNKNEIIFQHSEKDNKLKINNFNYLITNSDLILNDGLFGIGFPNDDSLINYSLLDQLETRSIIGRKISIIEFNNKNNKGKIYFDVLPNIIMENYYHYGLCKLKINSDKKILNNNWQCEIKEIIIKDNNLIKFDYIEKLKFDYNQEKNFFPLKYLINLETEYFNDLLNNGNCNFGIKNNLYTFTCFKDSYDLLQNLGNISIILNNWKIDLTINNLFKFDSIDDEYEFMLYAEENNKDFIFGSNFLKQFIMTFNEDEEKIGFFNNSIVHLYKGTCEKPNNSKIVTPFIPPFEEDDNEINNNKNEQINNNNKNNYINYLMIIIILILGLFVLWLIFRYIKRKKYKDMEKFYVEANEQILKY